MEDVYDLRSLLFGIADKTVTKLLTGTPLESQIETISFGLGTFVIVNVVFLMLFFSQFAILWIERKWCARMQDRRGATTALRSLWVGENGQTAGEWWNMLPFGAGKPVGMLNGWLNKNFGNSDERAMVDRVGNRSWMGLPILPGFFFRHRQCCLFDAILFPIRNSLDREKMVRSYAGPPWCNYGTSLPLGW